MPRSQDASSSSALRAAYAHLSRIHHLPCTNDTKLLFKRLPTYGVSNDLNSLVRAFAAAIRDERQLVLLLQTTVGAVNAYVAARAALASSPTDSLWTWFMTATAREFWAGRPAGFAAVSLGCAAPGSSAFRLTVMGSAAAVQRMQGALQGAPEAGLRCPCSRGCPISRG